MHGLAHGLLKLAAGLLVGYGALTVLAYLLVDRVLFQPPAPSYGPASFPLARVPVGAGDTIAAIHLPNPNARFTILFSHGNAEDLGNVRPFLEVIRDYGFAVVAYDYRGYGQSRGGRPTARKAAADAEAVYRYATATLGIPPARLVLHGRSLGSGPAVLLASRYDVAGLILESAFTSPYRVVTRVPILPFDRFPNLARIPHVRCPVLVIHGTADAVIPVGHGRALYQAAGSGKQSLWVAGAGHNDLFQVAGTRYRAALQLFADALDTARSLPR